MNALVACVVLATAPIAFAQIENADRRTISVTGSASISVVPDVARIDGWDGNARQNGARGDGIE